MGRGMWVGEVGRRAARNAQGIPRGQQVLGHDRAGSTAFRQQSRCVELGCTGVAPLLCAGGGGGLRGLAWWMGQDRGIWQQAVLTGVPGVAEGAAELPSPWVYMARTTLMCVSPQPKRVQTYSQCVHVHVHVYGHGHVSALQHVGPHHEAASCVGCGKGLAVHRNTLHAA